MVAQAQEYTATKLGRSANERGTPMPVRAQSSSSVAGRTVPSRWTWISALGRAARSPETVVDNAPCRFAPRVQVVTRGQSVRVRSSDPVLHNAHSVLVAEPEVSIANLALAVSGQTMDLTRRLAATLPASGEALVRLGCDVHPWMRGWLVVLDHPYAAVTGADGRFAIAAVPAGSYTLAVWHETLGRTERPATVPPGATLSIDFTLSSGR